MKTFYKINLATGYPEVGISSIVPLGFVEYTVGQEPAELKALLDAEVMEELIAHYKRLYLGVVDAKLKELDYDSLATVKLWEGDATFGVEASKILTWYKAIIAYNYALLTAGPPPPSEEDYLLGLPIYV